MNNRRHFGMLLLAGALTITMAVAAANGTAEAKDASPAPVHTEFMEFDITWVGVSVGSMTVREEQYEDQSIHRAIHIKNRPWISLIYPVDNLVVCRITRDEEGPLHDVTKKMGEKDFLQNDILVLRPDQGRAIWTNAVSNTVHQFDVPAGAKDFVSFFFDLREAGLTLKPDERRGYQLVMDEGVHALELSIGPSKTLRTPFGKQKAVPVHAVSKSESLFSRNRPKAVWISENQSAVLFADVQSRFGAVRATLTRWELDGKPAGVK